MASDDRPGIRALEDLQGRIGYRFDDPELLRQALTHKSYSNEQPGHRAPHNERLEFLGDAVLDLAVSRYLFQAYPQLPEGELTRLRAEVVSEPSLASLARSLELGGVLRLGRGEERSGGRAKASLLADALEALLGALYLEGGLDAACRVIDALFVGEVERALERKSSGDYKTRLQELLQGRHGQAPSYAVTAAEGPDHQRTFSVSVSFDGEVIGSGRGSTKKRAEQEAARQALMRMEG